MLQPQQRITDRIRADHDAICALLHRMEDLEAAEFEGCYEALRSTVARHESAEEVVLYPALQLLSEESAEAAAASLSVQRDAEALLAVLEKSDPSSDLFRGQLAELARVVHAHQQTEEHELLPRLESGATARELRVMGRQFDHATQMAATHPHPHRPDSPPANILAGVVLAFVDRFRDSLRERSHQAAR